MNELTEGAKVVACWTGGNDPKKWVADDHETMVIVMQPGQGGMVPWIKVVGAGNKRVALINCASLEGVRLAPKEEV